MKLKRIVLFASAFLLSLLMSGGIYCTMLVKAEARTIYVDASNVDDSLEDGSLGHPFDKIQEGVDAAVPGDKVFVYSGTYYEWNIVLDKDGISLVGEDKINSVIDGMNYGWILTISAKNVTVTGFTIQKSPMGTAGVFLDHATKSKIRNNIIRNHDSGIYAVYSNSNIVESNLVTDNNEGIILSSVCKENKIVDNYVEGNTLYAGIDLSNGAHGNEIKNNKITQNRYGILITFENNLITGNYIINNSVGIYEYSEYTREYKIFHNNFVKNMKQIDLGNLSANLWDNQMEGNYWSDYNGTDFNQDGVGDSPPYVINGNNTDNNPLMGIFHNFKISSGQYVNVISNLTIENLEHSEPSSTIKMHISNSSAAQTYGFCRVCIPHTLMNPDEISVIIDDGQTPISYQNYTLYDNGTHRWIYFAYEHPSHEVLVGDTTPPSLSILSPQNKTYNSNDVPLTFTVSETPSWIGYSLDGQTNVTINENTTLYGLSQGSHNLMIIAKDRAGNIGAYDTVYFTIETQQDEAFQTLIVSAVVAIAVVIPIFLVYFVKVKKTNENAR